MAKPKKPNDALVTNGWYIELPGINPLFKTLDGLQKINGDVEVVDAGSNKKLKFGSQIVDFGELTLVRQFDGSADDRVVLGIADECIENGLKFPSRIVKLHYKTEVFSVALVNFRFKGYTFPTFDTAGEETFDVSFTATCDDILLV